MMVSAVTANYQDYDYVDSSQDMDNPNVGKYLFIEADVNKEVFRDLFLTNDGETWDSRWGTADTDVTTNASASILIQETDWKDFDGKDDLANIYPKEGIFIESTLQGPIIIQDDIYAQKNADRNGALTFEDNLDATDIRENGFKNIYELAHKPLNAIASGNANGCDTFVQEFESCAPIHRAGTSEGYGDGGMFEPKGDIIVGNYPTYYQSTVSDDTLSTEGYTLSETDIVDGSESGEGNYFFICREGAEMYNGYGETVPLVVKTDNALYQCNPGEKSWVLEDRCDDGLDNDGDGLIDATKEASNTDYTGSRSNDLDCEGTPSKNYETPDGSYSGPNPGSGPNSGSGSNPGSNTVQACPESGVYHSTNVEGLDDTNGKVVLFNIDTSNYDGSNTLSYVTENGDGCGYTNFNTEVSYDGSSHDWPIEFECRTDANGDPTTLYYEGPTPSKVDRYCNNLYSNAPEDDYRHSSSMRAVQYRIPKEVIPTGTTWAYNSAFGKNWLGNYEFQTLHQAEETYSGNNDPHAAGTWNTEGKGMEETDGYPDVPPSFDQAWITANAGANSGGVISQGDTISEDRVFDGGFAGKCETGENWERDEGEWRCSGSINFDMYYHVPDVKVDESGQTEVGVFVDSETFSNMEAVWNVGKESTLDVNYMDVMCFAGNDPTNVEDSQEFTKRISIPDTVNSPLVGVTGQIDLNPPQDYTCKWHFEGQANGELKIFDGEGSPYSINKDDLSSYIGESVNPDEVVNSLKPHTEEGSVSGSTSYDFTGENTQQGTRG